MKRQLISSSLGEGGEGVSGLMNGLLDGSACYHAVRPSTIHGYLEAIRQTGLNSRRERNHSSSSLLVLVAYL